jgi:hypothetical protein
MKKAAKQVDPRFSGPITSSNIEELDVATPNEEKVKKAEKFFPYIQVPTQPILDGENEREEEPIAADSPIIDPTNEQ